MALPPTSHHEQTQDSAERDERPAKEEADRVKAAEEANIRKERAATERERQAAAERERQASFKKIAEVFPVHDSHATADSTVLKPKLKHFC